jgi:hypothetical protein
LYKRILYKPPPKIKHFPAILAVGTQLEDILKKNVQIFAQFPTSSNGGFVRTGAFGAFGLRMRPVFTWQVNNGDPPDHDDFVGRA